MARKGRSPKGKSFNKKTLILCEGKVETLYFKMLTEKYSKNNVSVSIIEQSSQGSKLVDKAVKKSKNFEEVYVVFDRDNLTNDQLSEALTLAKKNNIKILLTVQQFEYWLLLHFEHYNNSTNKQLLERKLCTHIGVSKWNEFKSDKFNDLRQYFIDNINTANNNAQKLNLKDINLNNQDLFNNPYTNISYYLKDIFNVKNL